MKKILSVAAAMIFFAAVCGAQAQINTKKVKIADFTQKTTKVVLTGNTIYDSVLKDEISSCWRVSPFEFCTGEEFEALKENDEYYFLITTKGQFRREEEPSLQFLTLVKGGKKAEDGIDEMLEIVSMPICSAAEPSSREFIYMPAFLDIIQNYSLDSMDKDINAYGGLANYSLNLSKASEKNIVFSADDLAQECDDTFIKTWFCPRMSVADEDETDDLLTGQQAGTLVSYMVAPASPQAGSFCYKMLIDTQTHLLFYYRRHRITKKFGVGFLPEDIKKIAAACR